MQNDIHSLISAIASICYPKQATTKIGRSNTLHLQAYVLYSHKYMARDMTHSLLQPYEIA